MKPDSPPPVLGMGAGGGSTHPNQEGITMAIQLRLGKEDQEKYGGPEWVTLDIAGLDDVPWEISDPLEREIWDLWECSIDHLAVELTKSTGRGKRGCVWLARKLAGIETPSLADFEIKHRQVRPRVVKPKGAAVPPGEESSPTLSEEEPSATPSP